MRKGVLRNFAKFIGKDLCQSLSFDKVAGPASVMVLKLDDWIVQQILINFNFHFLFSFNGNNFVLSQNIELAMFKSKWRNHVKLRRYFKVIIKLNRSIVHRCSGVSITNLGQIHLFF